MEWKSIDTQADLDQLDQQICWSDASTVEYYAKLANEKYFPVDISRSGYEHKNVHVLCQVFAQPGRFLELVLIACDWCYLAWLDNMHLNGHVDRLKRIDIRDPKGSTIARCARLIYRFLQESDLPQGLYFRHADSIASEEES